MLPLPLLPQREHHKKKNKGTEGARSKERQRGTNLVLSASRCARRHSHSSCFLSFFELSRGLGGQGSAGDLRPLAVFASILTSRMAHAYMHTCIHAYMHTCIHAYMHTCIHAYMHTCPQAVAGLWLVW